jgi:hypothetical protein
MGEDMLVSRFDTHSVRRSSIAEGMGGGNFRHVGLP